MDENWRNIPNFYVPLGTGPGGVALEGPKSILLKHSQVAYQIKDNEE